jgi:hypothetical protein
MHQTTVPLGKGNAVQAGSYNLLAHRAMAERGLDQVNAEVFVPISWTNEDRQQIVSNFDYSIIARLRPNVTVQQATVDPLNVALVN